MTTAEFARLTKGNIITTQSGVNKYMVMHTVEDARGNTVSIGMLRAAQMEDAGGYNVISQDKLVEEITDSTILIK